MGTHPIFESDFDCLTEMSNQRSKPSGSKTEIIHQNKPEAEQEANLVINARRTENERRPRVSFTQDTVDNEGMGKKSSKVCCIYKKPKAFGESSSESDSSDDDVSPYERKPKIMKNKNHKCKNNSNKSN